MSGYSFKSSVTELVEFSARRGNLGDHFEGPTYLEGIRGHSIVQKKRLEPWQKEFALKQSFDIEGHEFYLAGRCDLVCHDIFHPIVEEIKTTYWPAEVIPQAKKDLHWAQAKVYAYLFSLLESPRENSGHDKIHPETSKCMDIDVRLTWFNVLTGKENTECQLISSVSLEKFSQELIKVYVKWLVALQKIKNAMEESARKLNFPFPQYRPNQYDFSRAVYSAVQNKKNMLVEAPTGSGKTLSTLFPAIKSLGSNLTDQIVYLTCKGSALKLAQDTLELLIQRKLVITYSVITAKEKVCPCLSPEARDCRNEAGLCTRTQGFFDRFPDARKAALERKFLDRSSIQEISETYHICPFELSLQAARWSAIVLGDVNYVYDPLVHLPLFDENRSKRVILIDEVHNFPDRARDMYSAELKQSELKQLTKKNSLLPSKVKTLSRSLTKDLTALCDLSTIENTIPETINNKVTQILEYLTSSEQIESQRPLFEGQSIDITRTMKSLIRFQTIATLFNGNHRFVAEKSAGDPSIRLRCLDAAEFTQKFHKSARSVTAFSATLSPIEFYRNAIGYNDSALTYRLPSSFPKENQLTLHCNYIDTRWQQRQNSLPDVVDLIFQIQSQKPGKYIAYFPSYTYLSLSHALFHEKYPGIATVIQEQGSDDEQRKLFLENFFQAKPDSVIGFAIIGGIFGEGIDYVGDSLLGTIIFGSGMPQISNETRLLEEHFHTKNINPFEAVFQFPGMRRILQTAGRVIRSDTDKGLVVLVDPRFSRPDFIALFPQHWQIQHSNTPEQTRGTIYNFWRKHLLD